MRSWAHVLLCGVHLFPHPLLAWSFYMFLMILVDSVLELGLPLTIFYVVHYPNFFCLFIYFLFFLLCWRVIVVSVLPNLVIWTMELNLGQVKSEPAWPELSKSECRWACSGYWTCILQMMYVTYKRQNRNITFRHKVNPNQPIQPIIAFG